MTGRGPAALFMTCDIDSLSPYQCLVRKHIEVFEASFEDVESNAQGRNKPIVIGQVGIGPINFYVDYALNNLFKDNVGPALRPISIGFTLIPF